MDKHEFFFGLSETAASIEYTLIQLNDGELVLEHDHNTYPSVIFRMNVDGQAINLEIDDAKITILGARPTQVLGLLLSNRLFY